MTKFLQKEKNKQFRHEKLLKMKFLAFKSINYGLISKRSLY